MKKQEIKKAVAKAKEKFIPKAIQEEAESQARSEVWRALTPPLDSKPYPSDLGESMRQESKAGATMDKPKNQIIQPNDPRLSGYLG